MPKTMLPATILAIFLFIPNTVLAADFNPDFIISDKEVVDYQTMTLAEINYFLQEKEGSLPYYYTEDYDGLVRTASEIIWLASKRYQINPKYALVLLQKEQSLIENPKPSTRDLEWATGYGVCDSCTTSDPAIQKYKGFGKQIDNGVGFMRFFLDNPEKSTPFTIGQTVTISDSHNGKTTTYSITPANQATANLYKYTPHYEGNFNFWNIWRLYFGQQYPDGSLVKLVDETSVWLIQNGKKRIFKSYGILLSRYNPEKIITINQSDLETFPDGPQINFPQYSYLRSPNGTVYLIINDLRHGFENPEALRLLGINPEEIIDVTWDELNAFTEAKSIGLSSAYPTGALLQDKTTGGVYYVENGEKFPIWSKEIMTQRFSNKKIIGITPEELDKYPTNAPIKFNDGELTKSALSSTVYVISNGLRHPIISEDVFNQLGYNWDNVINTTAKAVNLHPLGNPID